LIFWTFPTKSLTSKQASEALLFPISTGTRAVKEKMSDINGEALLQQGAPLQHATARENGGKYDGRAVPPKHCFLLFIKGRFLKEILLINDDDRMIKKSEDTPFNRETHYGWTCRPQAGRQSGVFFLITSSIWSIRSVFFFLDGLDR
jgi:hypothetical protein